MDRHRNQVNRRVRRFAVVNQGLARGNGESLAWEESFEEDCADVAGTKVTVTNEILK